MGRWGSTLPLHVMTLWGHRGRTLWVAHWGSNMHWHGLLFFLVVSHFNDVTMAAYVTDDDDGSAGNIEHFLKNKKETNAI